MNSSDLPLVYILIKPQARRRKAKAFAPAERLEDRRLLTGTFTPIVTFDGVTIGSPVAVVSDTAGNLFGVTGQTTNASGTMNGPGEVFEVPAGTSTINNLATFNFESAADYGTSLVIDSSGNLFGTEAGSTHQQGGTLFELAQGGTTLTALATFAAGNLGTVTDVDSSGDVFGLVGGLPFELVSGSGTITTLTTDVFLGTLQLGPDGNLYGTGHVNGADGTSSTESIFQISPTTSMVTTLAAFDFATTGQQVTGFTFDSSGDLVGFCEGGGPSVSTTDPNGQGTIWELPVGSSTISLIAGFEVGDNDTAGGNPDGTPLIDSSGDIYGFTINGGANGYGTIFEVPAAVSSSISRRVSASHTVKPAVSFGEQIFADVILTDTLNGGRLFGSSHNEQNGFKLFGPEYGASSPSSTPTKGVIAEVASNTTPPPPTPKKAQDPKTLKDAAKDITKSVKDDIIEDTNEQMKAKKGVTGAKPADEHADSGLSDEFAQLKQMFAQVTSELNSANKQLNAATPFFNRYNAEGNIITRLDAQLAKQTNPKVQARLQGQITAAENAQNTDADTDNADYDNATTDLNNASSGEAAIQTALDSLPALVAQFQGTFAAVPESLTPGRPATATVSFTNSGNATATGSLGVALALRPAGTSGSADVTLPTVRTPIHIAAGATANATLHFVVPKSLPAGSYSLVAQLDPSNAFSEPDLPTVIVSDATIAAT